MKVALFHITQIGPETARLDGLQPLEDDRGFFPPYYAAPVIRRATLDTFPELGGVLAKLAGVLDDATMQQMNYGVDENKRTPGSVARSFLEQHPRLLAGGRI